uniref:Erythrocyte membrane protein band 4.1-like 3 n=1 Tax=Nothobranchius kuhntae TaxID=321403 RepID=A0A1A8I5P0_NOTKU
MPLLYCRKNVSKKVLSENNSSYALKQDLHAFRCPFAVVLGGTTVLTLADECSIHMSVPEIVPNVL